jgi:hypothetical protein
VKLNDVGHVIATRSLELRGKPSVAVLIGEPAKDADDHYCPYQIRGIGDERVRYAMGSDAAQALVLALQKVGAELYTSKEAQAKELTWNGGEDLGFPVPNSLSDLPPKS